MHVHSTFSSDSTVEIRDIVRLWETKGILPIVCDHDSIEGSVAVYKEIRRIDSDIPLVLAEEMLTREGDIIGLFLTEEIPPSLTAEETLNEIKDQGALSIIPHPFSTLRSSSLGRKSLDSVIQSVDIIEGYNRRMMRSGENKMAREYAARHNKPCSKGSDAHSPADLGTCFMNIRSFDTASEFLANLKRGEESGSPDL
jgi:predicted metal-dependent phosphoesterase TrpH